MVNIYKIIDKNYLANKFYELISKNSFTEMLLYTDSYIFVPFLLTTPIVQ